MEIPTPSGWTTMGQVAVGDTVFDECGKPCRVTFVTQVMQDHVCYDVVFDDGTVMVADAEHQWLTKTHAVRKAETRRIRGASSRTERTQCRPRLFASIVTTEQIRETLLYGGRERNHSIDLTQELQLPAAALPIDPYVFGVWLGDGDSRDPTVTSADGELPGLLRAAGCEVGPPRKDIRSRAVRYRLGQADGGFIRKLRGLGVRKNKHIPQTYLRASAGQRLALLQGLMDTDGSVTPSGHCEFLVVSKALADGFFELCVSLGFKPTLREERATLKGRDCGPRYRTTFTPHTQVFRLQRKLARQHSGKGQANRVHRRYITEIRPRPSVPVRCIQVDSPSHLFLASRSMIPTHNTRSLVEFVQSEVESGRAGRIGIAGATAADVRDVLVEGVSGFLAVSRKWNRPTYEPSKSRLTWPNGARARLYSADEPDRFRGPGIDLFVADELAAWRYPEAWDQAMLSLRVGKHPRAVIATTPRPTEIIRGLLKREGRDVVVSRGRTADNRSNLAPTFLAQIVQKYEGTRLGRQELDGEVLDDAPGALWKRGRIEELRIKSGDMPAMQRVIVAVDPAVSSSEDSDETGIICAGIGVNGHGYVIEDASMTAATPNQWAQQVLGVYSRHEADRVIAEVNNGGDLVEANIRTAGPNLAVTKVRASRGKTVRAEPIAALYEQGRIHHVGCFAQLEDQMVTWDPAFSTKSPDRMDALVWAFTELMLGGDMWANPDWTYIDQLAAAAPKPLETW